MSHIAVCSICSKKKSEVDGLLPAGQRYLGTHIARAAEFAAQMKLPLYVMSGRYGFISVQELIPHYEHLLVPQEVLALSFKVYRQLRSLGIKEIHFFTKKKASWAPYREALEPATQTLGIRLIIHELSNAD